MNECTDRNCRDGIYKEIDKTKRELKECINLKADKLPIMAKIGILSLILTILVFIGGVPMMYAINASKDKQRQINDNHEQIKTYSIKQDIVIENQKEFKTEQKSMNQQLMEIKMMLIDLKNKGVSHGNSNTTGRNPDP